MPWARAASWKACSGCFCKLPPRSKLSVAAWRAVRSVEEVQGVLLCLHVLRSFLTQGGLLQLRGCVPQPASRLAHPEGWAIELLHVLGAHVLKERLTRQLVVGHVTGSWRVRVTVPSSATWGYVAHSFDDKLEACAAQGRLLPQTSPPAPTG